MPGISHHGSVPYILLIMVSLVTANIFSRNLRISGNIVAPMLLICYLFLRLHFDKPALLLKGSSDKTVSSRWLHMGNLIGFCIFEDLDMIFLIRACLTQL